MTEFGRLHLDAWFRVRAGLLAVGLLVILGVSQLGSVPSVLPLLLIIAIDGVLSAFGGRLAQRFTPYRTVQGLLLLDLALTFLAVFYSGGLDGGLSALYLVIVLNALLMLGQRAALHFALLASFLFVVQFVFEFAGISAFAGRTPVPVEFIGQALVLALLIGLALFLVSASTKKSRRLAQDMRQVQAERAEAERIQRQWVLIHNVALRVQASTSPEQIYAWIGEELEREGLHCAILEWAEPNISFRSMYVSRGKRMTELAQEKDIELGTVRLYLRDAPLLARAVKTRMPELVVNRDEPGALRLDDALPANLMSLLVQGETSTLIVAPLLTQESVSGMLLVWGKDLGEQDRPPLAALAQQAASALEKARLLTEQQKRAAQLELVSDIAARVSTAANAEQIIQPLVHQVGELFQYEIVSVLLMNAANDQLRIAANYSTLDTGARVGTCYPLDHGILGWVATNGRTYLAKDTLTDPIYSLSHPERDPIRSELVLPLRNQSKILGVLNLASTQADAFDISDVNALTLLANQVSAALIKTRVLGLEQKRAAQLALVSEIAARAAAYSDPDAIMRTMVQLVQERFGYHHVCISLYNVTRNELEQGFAAGANAALFPLGKRWSAEEGLIGLAARTHQTIYSGDLKKDPRNAPDLDGVANAALCVPLVSGRIVIGVLDIESDLPHAFDANDIGAMETLANQMAAALEKARSLQAEQRRAVQMALVNQIASRTAHLMPATQLVREAVELIRTQFGYYNVAVFVTMEDQPGVRLAANSGPLGVFLSEPYVLTAGIIAHVGKSGNTYLCPDPQHDSHYVSPFARRADDPIQAELTIPLRRGDAIIGVLDIQSETANAYSPGDITALEALADQLAAALENARLYESEAQRAAQLESLRILSLELTAERDMDLVLASIVSSAEQLVQAEGASLYIVDQTRGDLVVRIRHNLPDRHIGLRLQVGEGLAGKVVATGDAILVADYANWAGRAPVFDQEHYCRVMGVPLKWQNRVLGVINLHRGPDRPLFTAEELRFANLFAAQAAIAMENARLLNALHTRLDVQQILSESSAMLMGSTEPQAILDQAVATALRVVSCESAAVFLPDSVGRLNVHAHIGGVRDFLSDLRTTATVPETAYTTKLPAHRNDSVVTASDATPFAAAETGLRSELAVPMLLADRVVGVLAIGSRSERHFDAADIQTLSLVANQTASALDRARYFLQVQGQVRELNLLFEGSRSTGSTLDPGQVIAHMLEQLVRAFDLTSAYFIEIDPGQHRLTQTHEYFSARALDSERATTVRSWSMEPLPEVKQVLGRQVRISNVTDANLSDEMRAYMREHFVHTILRVPLAAADAMLGYISLWDTRAPRAWSAAQIRFVQTLASQSAAALINAQVYQAARARTRELQALHDASQRLNSTLEVRAICEYSMDSLQDLLGYQHVSLYFLDNDRLRLQVHRGFENVFDDIPLTRGVMARAANSRETIFLPDVRQEPAFLAAVPNVQSEIAVPLLAGDRVLGVLNVETIRTDDNASRKQELTASDAQLLTTFANQLVVAIENARLFQATQQGLAQVRTLHIANQAINADLELETVLERVARQYVAALDVDFCTLLELDEARRELVVLFDLDPDVQAHVNIGDRFPLRVSPHFEWVLETTTPIVLHVDEPTLEPLVRAELLLYHCRTELVLPLMSKGHVIGLIELGDRKQVREFRADEIQMAESLSSQAAVALANARLYHTARQRLQETETLYRFARELGGMLDIQQLGKRALDAAARLTDFDVGEVSLVRAGDGALIPLVMTGNLEFDPSEHVMPRGVGIIGWVVEHGRAVRVDDVSCDPRYKAGSPHMMSELCLPLRAGERVIGVLNLEAKAPNAFDAHVEELLVVFANQLAIAIENARLYEQTKRDAQVKEALLRELSHRVKNNLAAITSLLYMALDEPADTREKILGETLGRVQSMALAHALLARSGEARVNLLDLGRQVLDDAVRNLTLPGAPVKVEAAGDIVYIGARQTTTLALVLNELATNSLRHGFVRRTHMPAPTLEFSVSQLRHEVVCTVSDNGVGLPDTFAIDAAAGLGLSLVQTLVEKDLHGRFTLQQDSTGTRAEIRFRLEELLLTLPDFGLAEPVHATEERTV